MITRHLLPRLLLSAVLAAVVGRAIPASALPIPLGSAPTASFTSSHPYQPDYAAFFVADLVTNPIEPAPLAISTGVTAGYWQQQLSFPSGFPNLQTGDTFTLQELLNVDPGAFNLTKLRFESTSPDWKWVAGSIFDNLTASPLGGLDVTTTDSLLSFDFAPVAVDTDLFVVGALQYVGAGGPPSSFSVNVYAPVPEPGTAFFGLALAGAAGVVRRRERAALLPSTASH